MKRCVRFAVLWASVLSASVLIGCATHPTEILQLADAEGDREISAASDEARRYLRDGNAEHEVRVAAAITLGRLRVASEDNISALGGILANSGESPKLRAASAWALGEMRSDGSLRALSSALRSTIDALSGQYLLEAIAKHEAFLAGDRDRLVEVVEALVFFAGNQAGRTPPIYDVLGERTRTLPVNISVLRRAVDAAKKNDPRTVAAMYNAVYELLARIERSRAEIEAGPAEYQTQLAAAVGELNGALRFQDPQTTLFLTWYLGRLGGVTGMGAPSVEVLTGARADLPARPTLAPGLSLRFVGAWTLTQLQLAGPGPRLSLARDVLARESGGPILRMLGELSSRTDDYDQAQKILGVSEAQK